MMFRSRKISKSSRFKTLWMTGLAAVLGFGALSVSTTLLTVTSALAQSASAKSIVDQAIRAGTVGETASGYLALVKGTASAEITNAMNEVNIKRKSVYTQLARAQNVSVEVVAALTGEKQIAKAQPGEYVKLQAGGWQQVR